MPSVWYPADRFQHAPGRDEQPWFYPPPAPHVNPYKPPPRGRWEWVPDYQPHPFYPQLPGGCPACRNGGVCMCVRPERQITCHSTGMPDKVFSLGIDPATEDDCTYVAMFHSDGTITQVR